VAIGGGSAIDTAKATAMLVANGGEYADYQWGGRPITRRSHPLIAVPTTAGTGSEVSKVAVISDPTQPFKKGVLSPLMFAHVAVIDPAVTVGLPPHLTAATGMDAFIHALEAYTGLGANPISDMLALESLRLVVSGLERATSDGADLAARREMMLAAIYGGMAMDQAGLGLVHALSGGLCSHLHLHHGLANALILPYVAEFNMPAVPDDRRHVLNELFGLDPAAPGLELVDALSSLVEALGLPVGLVDRREQTADLDWDAVAEESMRMVMIKNNPRPVTTEVCRSLFDAMR
jgi:alcohol dehydrogenase